MTNEMFYEEYDAAVAMLPADLRAKAHVTRATGDRNNMVFDDEAGREMARVCGRTVTLPGESRKSPDASKAEPASVKRSIPITGIDAESFGTELGRIIADVMQPLVARVAALEKSNRGRGIKFLGRYNRDVDYMPGDMVAHGRTLWIASVATADAPGASIAWQRMLTLDKASDIVGGDE